MADHAMSIISDYQNKKFLKKIEELRGSEAFK